MEDPTKIEGPVDTERWQRIKEIFAAASVLLAAERSEYLSAACDGDDSLRNEVEKLLDSFESGQSFLESPAIAEAPSLFEDKQTVIDGKLTGESKNGEFVAGTILSSRYRIVGLLGRGGMGEVYKAEDIKLSQIVALKFLPDHMERNPAVLERFHTEVRTARQVSHPNVCRVFDIGEVDGRHFLSMEFIDGDDLSSLLRRVGRLPSERAIEISRELCIGLAAIHNAGILHRDFKPANVIVDSRGKVRITDFGIAGLASEIAADSLRVGTPAYMSPEQIDGKGVTTRSDVYALGLVLYEIFTGKQAFTADTLHELIKKHRSETPSSPSTHVKGIDPIVESVISQCLEKDPKDRPQSALHIAMALPGGNPMQVALDAGEIPSPEMVAASPKKGSLRPAVAWAYVAAGVAMIVFAMFAAMKVGVHNVIPFNRSPDVLSERASEILAKLGYDDQPLEKWRQFEYDTMFLDYAKREGKPENWAMLATGQPSVVRYSERHSPRFMRVLAVGSGDWMFEPQTSAGMRTIDLDTRGRLVEFSSVAPQLSAETRTGNDVDWTPVFAAAELDQTKFKETTPQWTPPVSFDKRTAWEGTLPGQTDVPLRIETAGFQGRVVYFRMIYPWTNAPEVAATANVSRDWVGLLVFAILMFVTLIVGIYLARRNVLSGTADRRGAIKSATIVFVLMFAGYILSFDHVSGFFPEIGRFSHAVRASLFFAAITWLLYLALEPIVRRNMPDLIVSWNRLLAGDWFDPLVGRDVLAGVLFGAGHFTLIRAGRLVERYVAGDVRVHTHSENFSLMGMRYAVSELLNQSAMGVVIGVWFICFVAILVLFLRRRLFAEIVVFGIWNGLSLAVFTDSMAFIPFVIVIALLNTMLYTRFGLLSTIVSGVVFAWWQHCVFTLNFSAWYASPMLLTVAMILALLIYGARTSIAGRSLFGQRA